MAASSYGDSYRADDDTPRIVKRKKVKSGRTYAEKLAARTTPSSRARFKENHPRGGGKPDRAKPPKPVDPLAQRADALTALRYGGAEQSLNQRAAAIPSWFDNYRTDVIAQNQAYTNQSAPIVQQAQQRQQAASQVAPGIDVNTPAGRDALAAAAARGALEGLGITTQQSIINANQGYNTGRQQVASTAEAGEQGQLARDRMNVAKEKGLYRATAYEEARQRAHTERLENKAYNLDVTQEQNKAASDRADRRADRREKNQAVNQYGYTNKAWRALSADERRRIMADVKAEQRAPKAPKKPDGKDRFGNTKVQRRANNNAWDGGRTWLSARTADFRKKNRASLVSMVQEEANVPHDIAKIVVARVVNGYLTPQQARKLRRLGIKYDKKIVRSGKPTTANPPSSVPGVGNIIGQVLE